MEPFNSSLINKNAIINLIAKGHLLKAAEKIFIHAKQESIEEITYRAILLSMELSTLERAIIDERVNWEVERQTKSKLARRLLNLIDEL